MNIDNETMKQAVAKAVLDSLGEDGKRLVLEGAVASLLEPDESKSYSYNAARPTKLQKMFSDAADFAANRIIREELETNEEFKDRIRKLVATATEKLFESDALASKLSELVTETVQKLILRKDY